MFSITLRRHHWIDDDGSDHPDDLCLHGDVEVRIGSEVFRESCTVSATALYLLKTLREKHLIDQDNQMLPHCGYFLIPDESNDTVTISGCPNGIDWTVIPGETGVELITAQELHTTIDTGSYARTVYAFVDTIQAVYESCAPKMVPKDEFGRSGYVAFWNEWLRRRNAGYACYFCPAISKRIDVGRCREYRHTDSPVARNGISALDEWIDATRLYEDSADFVGVCSLCIHRHR